MAEKFTRFTAVAAPYDPVNVDTDQIIPARFLKAPREQGYGAFLFHDAGFRSVIAPSFGDIFFNNCMKNGIVPVRLGEELCASLRKFLGENPGAEVTVDLTANKVTTPLGEFAFSVPPFFREMLLEGVDEIGLTLSMLPQIEAFEKDYAASTPWLTPLS